MQAHEPVSRGGRTSGVFGDTRAGFVEEGGTGQGLQGGGGAGRVTVSGLVGPDGKGRRGERREWKHRRQHCCREPRLPASGMRSRVFKEQGTLSDFEMWGSRGRDGTQDGPRRTARRGQHRGELHADWVLGPDDRGIWAGGQGGLPGNHKRRLI